VSETRQIIGVIGGVGPYAGLDFVRNIFNNTVAERDQEHLDCMLVSCPALIPDRTGYLLGEGAQNPADGIYECAWRLYNAGCRCAALPCNTAHSGPIFGPLQKKIAETMPDFTLVNMIETCVRHIRENLPQVCRVGLLATKGTYKSGVYREYFQREAGVALIEPEEIGKEKIHQAIYNREFGIKAHSERICSQAQHHVIYEIYRLLDQGAQAVILGCTELPLAVTPSDFPAPLIDPGKITARALITRCAPEKLLPEK
jgi:aspartate racemase